MFSFNLIALITTLLAFACGFFVTTLIGPIWDRFVESKMGETFGQAIALGLSEETVGLLMKVWGIVFLCLVALGLIVLQSVPITVVICWLFFQLPSLLLEYWLNRRQQLLRDQLVMASIGLANSARAGLSLNDSIDAVSKDTPVPLRDHFEEITRRYECGITLESAISFVTEKIRIESFSLMSAALKTTHECGGNLSEAMERISESLHEHQRLDRMMETNTASARRSSAIMAVFPIIFLGIMFCMATEGTMLMFTTLLGQIILSVVIALIYVSKRWIDRVTTVSA